MIILFLLEKSLPLVFWLLIAFAFDLPYVAILTLLAAAIHEIGHLTGALLIKNNTAFFKTKVSGPKIKLSRLSYGDELVVLAFGPLSNLIVALVIFPITLITDGSFYLTEFMLINLLTALSNLLPIIGFDGYKILTCIFSKSKRALTLNDFLYNLSFMLSALLTLFSLFFILKIGEGYWAFILFFSILLSEITKRQNHTYM